nr:MAK10-like protein [Tanacetum cinerariifolium]
MGDEDPIRTLGDYSKPSHEGYRNTIKFPARNNVVPLRSDTIRLVQNICSFHRLRSEDPIQHLKDFLKLVGSLKLDAWTRFKDLLQKVPHHGIDLWLQVQIFYDHVNPITRRTINQSTGGKLRDHNTKESWALLEDLALYDSESWNDIRDFAKPVKEIYCMENPEQAFVDYASSHTDEAGDTGPSKFKADFKQQQSEMTNKIETVLKVITIQILGTLPSDMVKNLKLGTHLVSSARSYPAINPQCSCHPSNLINAIKTHFKEANISQPSLHQLEIKAEPPQPKEPKPTLEDEFQNLHLNLPVLKVLAHAPTYNAILDKYAESLELGKNGSAFV